MQQETAQKLIALLRAIDSDNVNDWVDLVCTAREWLPDTTDGELATLAFGCDVSPFSSQCCDKGTKGCSKRHNAQGNKPPSSGD